MCRGAAPPMVRANQPTRGSVHSSRVRYEAREPTIRTAASKATGPHRGGGWLKSRPWWRHRPAVGRGADRLRVHSPRPGVPPVAFAPGVVLAPAEAAPPGQSPYQRRLPVTLVGSSAYLASRGSVQLSDARTGQTTATVRPRRTPITGAGPLLGGGEDGAQHTGRAVAVPGGVAPARLRRSSGEGRRGECRRPRRRTLLAPPGEHTRAVVAEGPKLPEAGPQGPRPEELAREQAR